jgi:putative hydrolase of the HAD superfamily
MSYYLEAVEPMPESRELLKWAGEYYGVGLLTNIMPGCIQEMLRRGLLPDVNYDSIVDSSVVHAIKPESRIYEIAAQQAGANPDELLLVDDSRANLMAAEKLGWHVLWFDDYRPDESAKRIRQTLEPAA